MEGFQPEWRIFTIYHTWDTPFWPGTLEIYLTERQGPEHDA